METRIEPRLEKYVRRYHHVEQIIGSKEVRPMIRNKLRSETCLLSKIESRTVSESLQDNDWYNEMKEEIEKNEKNKTWTLVPRLADKNVIGTKWVFKKNLDEKGYAQEERLDYGETFAPFARMQGVRTLLAYVSYKDFKVYQMDVKFRFWNGILEEEVYIEKLEGFVDENNKDKVCKLHKALYGLKQAPRAWYERCHKHLVKIGFGKIDDNNNMYIKSEEGKDILISEIFMDDIIFGGKEVLSKDFTDKMKHEFEMSMFEEIKFFVGLQIHQLKHGIFVTQSKYINEILKAFGLEDSKFVSTPMAIGHKISKNDESAEVNQTMYKSIIGKLQYVVHSRPDIALAIGIVARFFANSRENHLMAVKKIIRYLKGTNDLGLYYKRSDKFELNAYTNADWGGNIDDVKRNNGEALFLGKILVTWTSKKQTCTSQSIVEVEYVATTINCTNIVWLKHLLKKMKEEITKTMILYCDNTSAINISKNLVIHAKTNHIAIKYHQVRELLEDKQVKMEYIHTKEQIVDIFTKPLPKYSYEQR